MGGKGQPHVGVAEGRCDNMGGRWDGRDSTVGWLDPYLWTIDKIRLRFISTIVLNKDSGSHTNAWEDSRR